MGGGEVYPSISLTKQEKKKSSPGKKQKKTNALYHFFRSMGVNTLLETLRKIFCLPKNGADLEISIKAAEPHDFVRFEQRKGLIIEGEKLMLELAEESPFLGDYSSYANAVRSYLEWLHKLGFEIIIVYDDGKNLSPLRKQWIHDGTDREDELARYFFTCQGESISEDTGYPGNELLDYQFKSVLNDIRREWKDANHENGLNWFNSNGEAATAIATYVSKRIAN